MNHVGACPRRRGHGNVRTGECSSFPITSPCQGEMKTEQIVLDVEKSLSVRGRALRELTKECVFTGDTAKLLNICQQVWKDADREMSAAFYGALRVCDRKASRTILRKVFRSTTEPQKTSSILKQLFIFGDSTAIGNARTLILDAPDREWANVFAGCVAIYGGASGIRMLKELFRGARTSNYKEAVATWLERAGETDAHSYLTRRLAQYVQSNSELQSWPQVPKQVAYSLAMSGNKRAVRMVRNLFGRLLEEDQPIGAIITTGIFICGTTPRRPSGLRKTSWVHDEIRRWRRENCGSR